MEEQTAVEFLVEELSAIIGKINFTSMQGLLMKDAIEKAKEMEKEQIKEAFKHGELPPLFVNYNAEEYYNETYKKD
jgi:hypothetical protein